MTMRLILASCVTCALAVPCAAQVTLKGQLEFSVGGAFQALTVSTGSTSNTYTFLNIPIRAGYFVTEGFELEAEGIVSIWEAGALLNDESSKVFVLSALASYNFTTGNVRPFLLAGVGLTNSYLPAIANTVLLVDANGTTRSVINAGAGFKSLIGNRAALRVEYRLQSFPESESEGIPGYLSHTIQVGASLFVL